MTGAIRRLQTLINTYGESFSVGTVQHWGLFSNVTVGTDKSYMSGAEVDAAGVPLFICLVRDDDTTVLADVVSWNALQFDVKRILQARLKGTIIAKMLVLSPHVSGGGGTVVEG